MRAVFLAIAMVVSVAAPVSSQQPEVPTVQTQPQTGGSAEQPQMPVSPVGNPADKPSGEDAEKKAKEAREEARQIRDVDAQESMANAAWRMVCLTIIQIVLAGGTIGFLAWTVIETGRTANAANRTAEIMETTAERQLRAYIFIDASEIQTFVPEMQTKVIFQVKNFGQTPAKSVLVGSLTEMGPVPGTSEINPTRPGVIAPTNEMLLTVTTNDKLTQEQYAAVISGKNAVYFRGVITYVDAFDKPRTTHFCQYYRGNGTAPAVGYPIPLQNTEKGNEYT